LWILDHFGVLLLKTSWLLSLLASANEKLDDRRTLRRYMAGILIVGIGLRFAYVFLKGFSILPSEAFNEASAFATRGELADAFGPGTGLTAHLSPGMPLLVGTIYRWLGVGTPLAEFALSCLSLAFIYVSFLALDAGFERLGVAPIARLGAIVLLALVPLNISLEMRHFRHWEGAISAASIALYLAGALALDARDRRPSWLELGLLACGAGLLSLFSPAAALGCYGMLGWLALRKRGWTGFAGATVASGALFVVISYPWALRNEAVFGEKVWTRTSFGLNFALAYYDKAINPSDPRKVNFDRIDEVNPFLNPVALANLRAAGGELGYNKLWTARTEEWVGQHPVDALKITARHAWEFYFPPRWHWEWDTRPGLFKPAMMWTIAFVGLVSLGIRLARRDWRYIYVAAALLLPMLPYVVAEPWVRYRYPIGGILVFLAADLVWRMAQPALKRPSRLPFSPALLFHLFPGDVRKDS
jgi:hypothetical protein